MAKRNKGKGKTATTPVAVQIDEGDVMATADTVDTVDTGTAPAKRKAAPRRAAPANQFTIVNTLNLDPSRVEILPDMSGRSQPIPESELAELAESMRRQGQLQPIQVREKEDAPGYYTAVFGISRKRAADMVRNGYTLGEKAVEADPSFLIRCDVVAIDDETAFVRNVTENAARKQCTPIDNARNQQRLRDEFGMSDAAITRLYGYSSQASVSRLKKLLLLPDDIQQSIHRGECTQAAGFLLADLLTGKEPASIEDVTAVYLAAVDASKGEESVAADAVVSAIKARRKAKSKPATEGDGGTDMPAADGAEGDGGADTPAADGAGDTGGTDTPAADSGSSTDEVVFPLTLKQFKDRLREMGADPKCPENVERASVFLLDTLDGKVTKEQFGAWFAANIK